MSVGYTFEQTENELKKITNNWEKESGSLTCWLTDEKQLIELILSQHYNSIKISDYNYTDKSWIIYYKNKKSDVLQENNNCLLLNNSEKLDDNIQDFMSKFNLFSTFI